MATLPPELCNTIAKYAADRDRFALALTCKAMQCAAEAQIYHQVVLRHMSIAHRACSAIVANDGTRGRYVKRFWFWHDGGRRTPPVALPAPFWALLQRTLVAMVNLDHLVIQDPACCNSWILNSPDIIMQPAEVSLQLPWDANTVAFLETQGRLRTLHTEDSVDDGPVCSVRADALQALQIFYGPVLVAAELLACPLTNMMVTMEEDTAAVLAPVLLNTLADMRTSMKTLRSLSIILMPDQFTLEAMQLISTSVYAPYLRHLGIIPLPDEDREDFYRSVMRLPALESVQLDVTHWEPFPMEPHQRMLVTELRIFCPSVRRVVFWITHTCLPWVWQENERWVHGEFTQRYMQNDQLWRSV